VATGHRASHLVPHGQAGLRDELALMEMQGKKELEELRIYLICGFDFEEYLF